MRQLELRMCRGHNVKTTRKQLAVAASIDRLKLPDVKPGNLQPERQQSAGRADVDGDRTYF